MKATGITRILFLLFYFFSTVACFTQEVTFFHIYKEIVSCDEAAAEKRDRMLAISERVWDVVQNSCA